MTTIKSPNQSLGQLITFYQTNKDTVSLTGAQDSQRCTLGSAILIQTLLVAVGAFRDKIVREKVLVFKSSKCLFDLVGSISDCSIRCC